jgi:hypothetical protein
LAGVTGPHDESEVVQFFLLIMVEEFGKATDLFVILIIKTLLDNLVHKVKNLSGVFALKCGQLIIK